jgi:hypothetical protein
VCRQSPAFADSDTRPLVAALLDPLLTAAARAQHRVRSARSSGASRTRHLPAGPRSSQEGALVERVGRPTGDRRIVAGIGSSEAIESAPAPALRCGLVGARGWRRRTPAFRSSQPSAFGELLRRRGVGQLGSPRRPRWEPIGGGLLRVPSAHVVAGVRRGSGAKSGDSFPSAQVHSGGICAAAFSEKRGTPCGCESARVEGGSRALGANARAMGCRSSEVTAEFEQ